MKTKGLTLAEALATGLPFKHKKEAVFYTSETIRQYIHHPNCFVDAFEPVWEVEEEPKPPMSIWKSQNGTIYISDSPDIKTDIECVEQLVDALIPEIKKRLEQK